jgi:hypothetical protein
LLAEQAPTDGHDLRAERKKSLLQAFVHVLIKSLAGCDVGGKEMVDEIIPTPGL